MVKECSNGLIMIILKVTLLIIKCKEKDNILGQTIVNLLEIGLTMK